MHFQRKFHLSSAIAGAIPGLLLVALFCAPLLVAQAPSSGPTRLTAQQGAVTVVPEKPRATSPGPSDGVPKAAAAGDSGAGADLFMHLTQNTYWVYRGTVAWFDQQTEKEVQANVTLKMTIQKVIQRPEFTIAILSGFPGDANWTTGEVEAMPWLLIETKRHEVFLDSMPPDFDYPKLEKEGTSFEKLLSEDNLLFRWPLKKGMKFGDAESLQREDDEYCWVVIEELKKNLGDGKGLESRPAQTYVLRYATNPDDTEIELSPGIGILSYEYHHHGTVADTSLSLVEFHPGGK